MGGRFLRHRSEAAREQAQRIADVSDERLARLVALATTLADRMEALPSAGPQGDLDRRRRVQVLRRTAAAGSHALAARTSPRADGTSGKHSA